MKIATFFYQHSFLICRFQRPPGPLPSSMLGLDALTGNLDEFGFEDYLNGNTKFFICSNLP